MRFPFLKSIPDMQKICWTDGNLLSKLCTCICHALWPNKNMHITRPHSVWKDPMSSICDGTWVVYWRPWDPNPSTGEHMLLPGFFQHILWAPVQQMSWTKLAKILSTRWWIGIPEPLIHNSHGTWCNFVKITSLMVLHSTKAALIC